MDMHHVKLKGISKLHNTTGSGICPHCSGADLCWGTAFVENPLPFPNTHHIKPAVSAKLSAKIRSCYFSQRTDDNQVLGILDFRKSPLKGQLADTLMGAEGKIKAKTQHMWGGWSATVTYRVAVTAFGTVVHHTDTFTVTSHTGVTAEPRERQRGPAVLLEAPAPLAAALLSSLFSEVWGFPSLSGLQSHPEHQRDGAPICQGEWALKCDA